MELATQAGLVLGIPWVSKISGRCDHDFHSRGHWAGNREIGFIGDIGFADDNCLLGEGNEIFKAEALLEQTMQDWREKVHPGKTENLRVQ